MTCTFFGHRELHKNIDRFLEDELLDLIENQKAERFYLGRQGEYDRTVLRILRKIKLRYPHIEIVIVLAYLDEKVPEDIPSIFIEELENVPRKYAIVKRNEWMIAQSDVVVGYAYKAFGGAVTAMKSANKKGKCVINLAEKYSTSLS